MRKEPDKKEEVEYKSKSGTAWSHSYLNQKPWHPLSYPNQRRKWIAEQTHAEHQRRADDVSREFAQEQEFFRTSAMLSKKEREKLEVMQAVSFMYMRPPGYNAESARAAEIAEEKNDGEDIVDTRTDATHQNGLEGNKGRVKDLYGKAIPTEEEFPVLKNAPRMESGASARVKPFAVEIRNVKCARCGAFGHQSGDRECPLKDSITMNEVARQKRDDPLTSMMTSVSDEPLKWELKHKPGGLSPPRGGFKRDDPNQQIIPEDIYDEYGGFLAGGGEVQDLLASLPSMKHQRKYRKRAAEFSASDSDRGSGSESECSPRRNHKKKRKKERNKIWKSSESDSGSDHKDRQRRKHKVKRNVQKTVSNKSCDDTNLTQRERKGKNMKTLSDGSSQSDGGSEPCHDRRHRRERNHRTKRRRGRRDGMEREGHFCIQHSKSSC